jgi:hypothetical protein
MDYCHHKIITYSICRTHHHIRNANEKYFEISRLQVLGELPFVIPYSSANIAHPLFHYALQLCINDHQLLRHHHSRHHHHVFLYHSILLLLFQM